MASVIFQLQWMALKGPELRCLLFPDLALAAHFSWEYNTGKPALIPCYVPLINCNNTHTNTDHVLNISLSFFLYVVITRTLNGCITLHCWLSFSALLSLWMPSFMAKCSKRNKSVTLYIFLASGLPRLIACVMTTI